MIRMTPRQIRFINEYCVDENATQAAIRAGYSTKGAGTQGHLLLKDIEISRAIKKKMAELAVAASITPEWVVSQWAKIATANPSDIVQVRKSNCRYCHGIDHQYQWTTRHEYEEAVDKANDAGKKPPEMAGGFGFDPKKEPSKTCPSCGGLGEVGVHINDTRKLKDGAKLLYAGAEQTRNGIKVNMRDQDAALVNLARYLGMMVDKKEISGPNGGPLAVATLTAEDLTDDQLAAILKAGEDDDDVADEA